MDYIEREKEFYKIIERTKENIESMEIPESEKIKLYELVNETIQRYEGNKLSLEQGIVSAKKYDGTMDSLVRILSNLSNQTKETLEQVQSIEGMLESKGKLLN
jgi:CHASE3 domain sensor protein